MILIQNDEDLSESLSNALSRAISRLLLISPEDDKYLEKAVTAGYLTKVSPPYVDDRYDDSSANNEKDRREATDNLLDDLRVEGRSRGKGVEDIEVYNIVCGAVANDSDDSMPGLDSDGFVSDDSTNSSSSESDSDSEEDYRFGAFPRQNFGTFEIYPSTLLLKRSQSNTDLKKRSEQIVASVCRSTEDLVETGGDCYSYFNLLEDIANIFIEKHQFFPSEV